MRNPTSAAKKLSGIDGLRYALADPKMDTIDKLEELSQTLNAEGIHLLLFNSDDQSEKNNRNEVSTFHMKEKELKEYLEDWEKVVLPRFGW